MRRLCVLSSVLLGALFASPGPASAYQTETLILVQTEDDLRELYLDGVLEQEELDHLVILMRDPVDLNTADREALFELPGLTWPMVDDILDRRRQVERFSSVSELAKIESIPDDVLEMMRPFVRVRRPPIRPVELSGDARFEIIDNLAELGADAAGPSPPAMHLRLRGDVGENLRVGGHLLLQERTGPTAAMTIGDDTFQVTEGPSWGSTGNLLYGIWEKEDLTVALGNFRAGWGRRLTFDSTDRMTPNGFYPDTGITLYTDGARFSNYKRGLLGVGAQVANLKLGSNLRLQASALYSAKPTDVYQYSINPSTVYIDRLGNDERARFLTLTNAFLEQTLAGNATVRFPDDHHVGITAYVAMIDWLLGDGVNFSESHSMPRESPFGAVGVDTALRLGEINAFGEVTGTFNGGLGLLAEMNHSTRPFDLSLIARHYSIDFENPRARAPAAPTQYLGNRQRAESGLRAQMTWKPQSNLQVRFTFDPYLNTDPDDNVINLYTTGTVTYTPIRGYRFSLYGAMTDRDITTGGREQSYGTFVRIIDEDNPEIDGYEPIRAGAKATTALTATINPIDDLTVAASYRYYLEDVTRYDDQFQRSHATWLRARYRLPVDLVATGRLAYANEDLDDGQRGIRETGGYLDLAWRTGRFRFGGRYNVYARFERDGDLDIRDHIVRAIMEASL